ncbi:MAG: 3-deoxy-manno-octulosonate cytidylyltransferase [Planctomycetaceae bacterium]|nr:3-deoxy-manno-octulosonate cytidylyltransferase [Planctomycetaceae bacterium]
MARGSGPVVAVIPARYASTRLPGKPLLAETGKTLIQHVHEQVRRVAGLDRIVVATDDDRIAQAVKAFGGEAVMTSNRHPTGTDRIAEAVKNIDCAKVVNVQGDEPEIEPELIETLIGLLDQDAEMATLAVPFENPQDALMSHRVKVVIDKHHNALYFSRSRIPYSNGTPSPALLHLGLYGYTKAFLQRYVTLDSTPLEQAEKLEQLRALEHGYKIKVGIVKAKSLGGIDTPEDYAAFVKRLRERVPS